MPRASWRGFLRLSLVSCRVYLSPATTRAKPVRLHQVWRPRQAEEPEDDQATAAQNRDAAEEITAPVSPVAEPDEADHGGPATRIMLRPHDPTTGEEIAKKDVVKGYEYGRGQFVTFTAEELKALEVESSKVIDLEKFVPRAEVDPVYFDTPYYLYPEDALAAETLRVIGAAMADAGVAGIGRLTLSRRERMVIVESRGAGMALFTLRAATEVRPPQFGGSDSELDAEMVAIAGAIIRRRIGKFDPSTFRDRYQEALQQLVEAKLKGVAIKPRPAAPPPPVVDLMAALKRSLAKETAASKRVPGAAEKRVQPTPEQRQPALLLPLSGGGKPRQQPAAKPAATSPGGRRKA
jgi:DNA end-binding protein Ku